jgi:uncharacterized damage-inducible protein DinB
METSTRWSVAEPMVTVADILSELEQEAPATRRVLERVPAHQLGWKPHDKSMTLGQLAMHVANLPGAIAEISTKASFDVKTPIPRPEATSTSEVLALFEESIARAQTILKGMSDDQLATPWSMMNGSQKLWSIPRSAFLRSVMLNHWYHHRGQLTVYLRQTGAPVPAVYGDSADEKVMTG